MFKIVKDTEKKLREKCEKVEMPLSKENEKLLLSDQELEIPEPVCITFKKA